MSVKTPRFEGAFKWSALRQQLLSLREDVQTIKKVAGRNVTIDEHRGKGKVINVASRRPTGGGTTGTGACCVEDSCSIQTESDCIALGGTYQGDSTTCDPNPCCIILHAHLDICFQWYPNGHPPGVGTDCLVSVSESLEFDVPLQCPLDLTTSGTKGGTPATGMPNVPTVSQAVTGADCGGLYDVSGAFFAFGTSGLFYDTSAGWEFAFSMHFPHFGTFSSSPIDPGTGDLRDLGTMNSIDGDCPCSESLCFTYSIYFT